MSTKCRLCLRPIPSGSAIMLYRSFNATMNMVKLIEKYLEIKIEPDDFLSTAICQACYYHLEEFHRFYKGVAEKQLTLQNDLMEANFKKESCVDEYETGKTVTQMVMKTDEKLLQDEPAILDYPIDIIKNEIEVEDEFDQDMLEASYMENNKCPKLDDFCYVCGHIVPKISKQDRKNLFTEEFKTAYCHYFDETDLSGADFTPNTVCKSCYNTLIMWIHGKSVKLSFMKPVIWMEDLTGHDESRCYACINSGYGLNRKKLKTKVYIPAVTATLPVQRAADTDPPKPPCLDTVYLRVGR